MSTWPTTTSAMRARATRMRKKDGAPLVFWQVELIPTFDDDEDEDDKSEEKQGAVEGSDSSEAEGSAAGESKGSGETAASASARPATSASARPMRNARMPLWLRGTRVWKDSEPLGI